MRCGGRKSQPGLADHLMLRRNLSVKTDERGIARGADQIQEAKGGAVLSVGWGLIRSTSLTPMYDVTGVCWCSIVSTPMVTVEVQVNVDV